MRENGVCGERMAAPKMSAEKDQVLVEARPHYCPLSGRYESLGWPIQLLGNKSAPLTTGTGGLAR